MVLFHVEVQNQKKSNLCRAPLLSEGEKMHNNRKKNAGNFRDTGQHFLSLLMSYLPG